MTLYTVQQVCVRGHDISLGGDIYVDPDGRRKCRKCYKYRTAKRRVTLANVTPRRVPSAVIAGLESMYQTCWLCDSDDDNMVWDHVKPISKGGAHIPANLRLACNTCNSSKNAAWPVGTSMQRLDPARLP